MTTPLIAGRTCPLRYRYGAAALAQAPEQAADTLYVIGGLYGNRPALAAIEDMAAREHSTVTLCFNGDFNWFNIDDESFISINRFVLAHDAIQGNVEAELGVTGEEAGCGCAYPESVDANVVERSNLIHARLKGTACRHAAIIGRLAELPMYRRYRVGECTIGIVHGDAESLAGWRFDVAALDNAENRGWIEAAFGQANVDVFASTHTCLPALQAFHVGTERKLVINNGAAGMPNFVSQRNGLITRIGVGASPSGSLYGSRIGDIHVDALAVDYDHVSWEREFLGNWPPGSPAHRSYYERIVSGPNHGIERAHRSDRL